MQIKNPEHRLGGDYYVEIAEGDAKSGEASYWVNQGRKKTKVVVYRNGEK